MGYVIAVSGTSGSGKSTLVNELSVQLNAVTLLYFDCYQTTTRYPNDRSIKYSKRVFAIRSPAGLRIADGQKDRLRFADGLLEGFPAPGVPVDGIVGVLQQVRRLLMDQAVGVFVFAIVCGQNINRCLGDKR